MRRKSSGTILPDFPDMKNHPAVVKKKFVEQITIHPDSLRNLEEAFVREIEKYMNKWREKYRGVLIKIRSVKLNSELGEIHDEYPFVHCDVLYRTLIFQPERGTQLMGGVTQIFPSHIGLLVFGLYNAIILEENFGNKYAVDEDSEIIDKKTGQKLDVGDEINFTVEKVQSDAEGAFTIYGTFKKIATK